MKVFNLVLWSLLILTSCVEQKLDSNTEELYSFKVPKGFPQVPKSTNNPTTIAGVELGKSLFFDPILSRDSTIACVTCHQPHLAFTDGKAKSIGINDHQVARSSISLLNVAYFEHHLFWDGKASSLGSSVQHPFLDTLEMASNWEQASKKLSKSSTYVQKFNNAFQVSADDIDSAYIVRALEQYMRTLISKGDSKFDLFFYHGLDSVFSEQEKLGFDLFFDETLAEKDAECGHCHMEPIFTTGEFKNNAINAYKQGDPGRYNITANSLDYGKMKVPSLRNIEITAPYMHDGRFQTLEEVVEHYNSGGHAHQFRDPLIRPLDLNTNEKEALVAFLKTLTSQSLKNDVDHQDLNINSYE